MTALEIAELTRAQDMQRIGGVLMSLQAGIDQLQVSAKNYAADVMTYLKEMHAKDDAYRSKTSTKLQVLEARVLQLERLNADEVE